MASGEVRHWWVNHKQTFRQEIAGGYLWSPKVAASGARNQFYENMRLARRGENVVSYADGRIRALGKVLDTAITAPKPSEFRTGKNWSEWGWLLPVEWRAVRYEARPATDLERLLPALPPKYSPLHITTGKGLQNAYLSRISTQLLSLVFEWTGGAGDAIGGSCNPSAILDQVDAEECQALYEDKNLSQSEVETLILARRGQGKFREQVIALHIACVVTGISDPRLLRASHIQPWRLCQRYEQRIDPKNGLLLSPNIDQLFDRGLISFRDDSSIILSSTLSASDASSLGIHNKTIARISLSSHADYLNYHRTKILIP